MQDESYGTARVRRRISTCSAPVDAPADYFVARCVLADLMSAVNNALAGGTLDELAPALVSARNVFPELLRGGSGDA